MSKKAKSEVADNSADTVMDGVLSENQAKLNKLNSSIQAAYERRRKIITDSKLYTYDKLSQLYGGAEEQAESVKIAYDLYQKPSASLKDVIEYFKENDIYTLSKHNGELKDNMDRSHISRIHESPLYVRADKEVYAFFVSKGYEILDDIEAYDGIHGVFIHRASGVTFVKVGYHEGLVDASVWLAVSPLKIR